MVLSSEQISQFIDAMFATGVLCNLPRQSTFPYTVNRNMKYEIWN